MKTLILTLLLLTPLTCSAFEANCKPDLQVILIASQLQVAGRSQDYIEGFLHGMYFEAYQNLPRREFNQLMAHVNNVIKFTLNHSSPVLAYTQAFCE